MGGAENSASSTPVPSCSGGHQVRPPLGAASRSSAAQPLPVDGEHQLEKLEFALAIALTRGDAMRSGLLRDQIAKLGGNHEEPGT